MAAHNSLCTGNIWLAGSEAQKRKYIPDLASGRKIGAWALTEPTSGSDAAALKTAAKWKKDEWVLNGTKTFCTNAPVAGTFVIHAVTESSKGTRGISAFIVERGNPGLSIGKVEDKLGVRGSATSQVILSDCHVPKDATRFCPRQDRASEPAKVSTFVNAVEFSKTGAASDGVKKPPTRARGHREHLPSYRIRSGGPVGSSRRVPGTFQRRPLGRPGQYSADQPSVKVA